MNIPESWKCPHTPAQVRPMICQACTADEVFLLYTRINNAYRDGNPVCTDTQFDVYEKWFRDKFPSDKRFWSVGKIGETK